MNLFKILRMFFRSGNENSGNRIVNGLISKVFPEYEEFSEAVNRVNETVSYVQYESMSIEKDIDEIKKKVEDLQSEIKTVSRRARRSSGNIAS